MHNAFRSREGKDPIARDYYVSPGPQRMYVATPVAAWVLMVEHRGDGHRVRDYRQEISLADLIDD